MRFTILALALAALAVGGCATQGPGSDCDDCAVAEATPVPGGSAAAAAASGGQRTSNAPFAEDTARLAPQTTVGRGAGDTSSNSSDSENREVASGGAQNIALLVPTKAEASAGAGGTSASVISAQRVVDTYLAALQLSMAQVADPEQIRFLSEQVVRAQEALAKAEAGTRANVTHNYNMGGDNTMIGVSSSSTTGRPDPESVKAAVEGVGSVSASASKPSSAPAAPEDFPPPAGAAGDPIKKDGE